MLFPLLCLKAFEQCLSRFVSYMLLFEPEDIRNPKETENGGSVRRRRVPDHNCSYAPIVTWPTLLEGLRSGL